MRKRGKGSGLRSPSRVYYGWVLAWSLAFTVTVAYGVIYTFGVFLRPIEQDLGLTRAQSSAPLTLAYLVAGLSAPVVGRLLDRHGARWILTFGSALFALLLLLQAHATTFTQLLLIGVGLGVAMACVLYDVVFTVIAVWFAHQRARATLLVTLVGALASTVFIPLATWLEVHLGWRGALEVLAVLLAITCIPTHALLVRRRPQDHGLHPDGVMASPELHQSAQEPSSSRVLLRMPVFWCVALSFVLAKLAAGTLSLHLVPLLTERGLPASLVAVAAGAVGLVQLIGRVFFAPLSERLHLANLTALVFLVHAAGIAALTWSSSMLGVLTFVLLYGASNGAMTMARALLVADVFGTARYGSVNGWIALFVAVGLAAAPWLAGVGRSITGSYGVVLVGLILALVVAALLVKGVVASASASRHSAP